MPPLDTTDPFDAIGAGVGAGPAAPVAAAGGSVAPAVGPAINLPQVPGSVDFGGGNFGLGQGGAPATIDVSTTARPPQQWLPVPGKDYEAALAPDGSLLTRPLGSTGPGVPSTVTPAKGTPPAAATPAKVDPFDALGAGVGPIAGSGQGAAGSGQAAGVPAGKTSGYLANMGAGTSEAVAGLLGMPVDLVTGIINLVPRGINAVAGTNLPTIERPIGGSEFFQLAEGLIGANPQNVVPGTQGEGLARAAARGAASVVLPGGLARGVATGGPGLGQAVLHAMGQGAGAGGAAAGAGGGVVGHAAAASVPPEWAPLADVVGNIVGGVGAAGGLAGATAAGRIGQRAYRAMPFGARSELIDPATGAPFPGQPEGGTTAGQQGLARQQIIAASGQEPGALVRSIDAATAAQPLPGSQPTMGQGTGNLGLLRLERRQRTLNPQVFTEAEAARSVAQVNALRGMAGPEEAGRAAGEFVADRLAKLRAANDAIEAAEGETARRVTEQLGGNPAEAGMGDQELGAAHRAALEALRAPVKAAAGRMYQALDPDGRFALNVDPIGDAAAAIKAESSGEFSKPMGPEAEVVEAASKMRGVKLFSDLRKLDSWLGDVQREIKGDQKLGSESLPARRVGQLRTAVEAALVEGAKDEAAAKPSVGAALAGEAEAVPGAGTSVFTPSGREVGVRYRLAEAADLVASHDDDLRVNRAYPAELQPRNRSRAASAAQVQSIATKMRPQQLGASADVNSGAPIIGPDGVVESGNGRVLGIRRAYAKDNDSGKAYRAWLTSQGYDVAGMKEPILVRERTTPLSPEDRIAFAREAAAPTGLVMSATEQAAVDAERISDDMLSLVRPGDIDSTDNRPFVRAFVHGAIEQAEQGGFFTGDNALSVAGAARIRAALLQRAYGDADLVAALAETGDENIKAFGGALQDAAGSFGRLRAGIAHGSVPAEMDLAPAILEAVRLVQQARTGRVALKDAVGQQELGGGSRPALTEALLRAAYGDNLGGRASRSRMADLLNAFADEAQQQGTLFGENKTAAQVFQEAQARGRATGTGGGGGGNGTGAGQSGDQALGPGAGAAGEGNAAAAEGAAGASAQPPITQPPLEANFTPEARGQLRAANRAYAIYKDTFRRGAVGEVLQSGSSAGFKALESAVPAKLFKGGPGGAEAADSLIRAAGSPEDAVKLLGDYPAFAFRRAAEVDGIIDPKKAAAWIDKNKAALDKFPGLREKFADASKAGLAVQEASARGQEAFKAFQDSALAHYLNKAGEVVEPQKAMESLLQSPTAPADAKGLVEAMARDTAAFDGLQRNFVDHLLRKFSSTTEAGTTGEMELKPATVQNFLANPSNVAVTKAILGPDGLALLAKIGADIELVKRGITATRIPGSPSTAADLLAAVGHSGHGVSFFGQILGAEMIGNLIAGGAHVSSLGGTVGSTAMAAASVALNAMRLAGLRSADELATAGLLDPGGLGRVLVAQGSMADKPGVLRTLLARIAAIGVGSAAAGKEKQK